MDIVIKLREARHRAGLSQQEAAERSGIGVKTISSFESGARVESMKLRQLERLLGAYGITLSEFFSPSFDHAIAPWEVSAEEAKVATVVARLRALPRTYLPVIVDKILSMLDGVSAVLPPQQRAAQRPSASIH